MGSILNINTVWLFYNYHHHSYYQLRALPITYCLIFCYVLATAATPPTKITAPWDMDDPVPESPDASENAATPKKVSSPKKANKLDHSK